MLQYFMNVKKKWRNSVTKSCVSKILKSVIQVSQTPFYVDLVKILVKWRFTKAFLDGIIQSKYGIVFLRGTKQASADTYIQTWGLGEHQFMNENKALKMAKENGF